MDRVALCRVERRAGDAVLACPTLEQHTHTGSTGFAWTGASKSSTYPTGPIRDRKPQERLVQDPAPRLEIHPQSSLDSSHPCAHFGELHHQGTNVRWCNLILAKAGPSLTTGRLYSSLLASMPPLPARFIPPKWLAREKGPPAWPCTSKQARGTAEKMASWNLQRSATDRAPKARCVRTWCHGQSPASCAHRVRPVARCQPTACTLSHAV